MTRCREGNVRPGSEVVDFVGAGSRGRRPDVRLRAGGRMRACPSIKAPCWERDRDNRIGWQPQLVARATEGRCATRRGYVFTCSTREVTSDSGSKQSFAGAAKTAKGAGRTGADRVRAHSIVFNADGRNKGCGCWGPIIKRTEGVLECGNGRWGCVVGVVQSRDGVHGVLLRISGRAWNRVADCCSPQRDSLIKSAVASHGSNGIR